MRRQGKGELETGPRQVQVHVPAPVEHVQPEGAVLTACSRFRWVVAMIRARMSSSREEADRLLDGVLS